MKKILLVAALVLAFGKPAFAVDTSIDANIAVTSEMNTVQAEGQADPQMDIDQDARHHGGRRGGHHGGHGHHGGGIGIGGIIIGGIIGGIIVAESFDRDHGSHRRVTCFAENRWGDEFRATGRGARFTQREAMEQCYEYSRSCRPMGCERARRGGW